MHGVAIDEVLAEETVWGTSWALSDHLGTIHDWGDATTGTSTHYVYSAFGRILSIDGGDPKNDTHLFGFTGRETDADTLITDHWMYYRARYYNPSTGRFVSQDPIGFLAGDANLYRYVGNWVTGAADPSGLDPEFTTVEDWWGRKYEVRSNIFGYAAGVFGARAIWWWAGGGERVRNTGRDPNFTMPAPGYTTPMGDALGSRIGNGIGTVQEWERTQSMRDQEHKRNQDAYLRSIADPNGKGDATRPIAGLAANAKCTTENMEDVHKVADSVAAASEAAQAGKTVVSLAAIPFVTRPALANPFIGLLRRHGDAPRPRGVGPNGYPLQSHHPVQQAWANANLPDYDCDEAPTVLLETGPFTPHSTINELQRQRAAARVAAGKGIWSSTIDEELQFIVDDFKDVGFDDNVILAVLEQQFKMLKKLGIPFTPRHFKGEY